MKKFLKKIESGFDEFARVVNSPRGIMMLVCSLVCFSGFAVGGINGIASEITPYIKTTRDIVYAIAAIVAIVGAFNIYFKMNNGDQDVKKTIMLTLGGCIGLVALATALPAMFGH